MMDERIIYFPFGFIPSFGKSIEIVDYRWYDENNESRENVEILLKSIIKSKI